MKQSYHTIPCGCDNAAPDDRAGLVAVSAGMLLAAVLTLMFIADKSLWFDEVRSIVIANSWKDMWRTRFQDEANMWLYYNSFLNDYLNSASSVLPLLAGL